MPALQDRHCDPVLGFGGWNHIDMAGWKDL